MGFIKTLLEIYLTLAMISVIPLLCLGVFYLQDRYHNREIDEIYKKHGLTPPSGESKKSAVRTDDIRTIKHKKE